MSEGKTETTKSDASKPDSKVIAGFEIISKVGQGGMGAVFKARQISMQREVALKILRPNLATNESFKLRFLREARLCAKLNHPNIINGIDCGEDGKYAYFAMEFVDGETTREILKKRGRISLKESASIVRQIAEALAYIHKNNMVHRDVKPDNIMLDSSGVAKLCDLGLAKLSQNTEENLDENDGGNDDPTLTRAGQAVGTPFYMAPEVARGSANVDIRADIYCLGATFYHIVTGWPPFDGKVGKVVMKRHINEEAPSLRERSREVTDAWGWICSKMMAKSPDDRYRDPKELLADIDAALDGKPVKAASFKAKTSCATPTPTAGGKPGKKSITESKPSIARAAAANASDTPKHVSPVSNRTVGSGSARAERIERSERPDRADPEFRPARPVRSANRKNDTGAMIGLGVGVIAAVLVLYVLGSGGGGSPSATAHPAETRKPAAEPEPSPAPVSITHAAAPAAVTAPAHAIIPAAAAIKAEGPVAVSHTVPHTGDAGGAFDAALALEKKRPDDFAEILPAYEEASMLADKSALAPSIDAAQKAALERWRTAFEAALKPMQEKSANLAAKSDYAGAIAALNNDSIPENLRAADWADRIEKLRSAISDSADTAASQQVKDAEDKAAKGDAKSLTEALELIEKAAAAAGTRTASKAAGLKKDWTAKLALLRAQESAARNEKLAAAVPLVPALRARLAATLKRNDFASAVEVLNRAAADKEFAGAAALIQKEKDDIALIQNLRQSAVTHLRAQIGKPVKLTRGSSTISGELSDAPQVQGVALKIEGGSMTFSPEQLDAHDVDANTPLDAGANAAEDLRRHALLFMAAGIPGAARDYFQKAQRAGLSEPLDGYFRYLDILEFGEKELAARDAWALTEKLYADKKMPELKTALQNFQRQFAGTKTLAEQSAVLRTRLLETEGAAGEAAKITGTDPQPEAVPLPDTLYLSDMREIEAHVGVKELGKKGQMMMTTPPSKISVGGQESPNGLFTHPPSNGHAFVIYKVPKGQGYKTLKGAVGIDDSSLGLKNKESAFLGRKNSLQKNSLDFKIFGDGKLLWDTSVVDVGNSEEFDVDISNVEKLELRVECKFSNSGAYACWLEPRLTKETKN